MQSRESFKKNKRVLLVTEDDGRIEEFKSILAPEGITIFPYKNMQKVADLLAVDPNFAMILFDYASKQMEIDASIDKIRGDLRFHNILIVLLIQEENKAVVYASQEIGADDYILLPVDPLLLQLRIRMLLGMLDSRIELEAKEQELHAIKAYEQITVTLSHYINNAITPLMVQLPKEDQTVTQAEMNHLVSTTKKTINYIKSVVDALFDLAAAGNINVVKSGSYRGLLIDLDKKLKEIQKSSK